MKEITLTSVDGLVTDIRNQVKNSVGKPFKYKNYTCLIREICCKIDDKNGYFWYCGYVEIPFVPPFDKDGLYGADESGWDFIDVHGGITYAGYISEDFKRTCSEIPGYWIGFDGNHGVELSVFDIFEEIQKLVDQLIQIRANAL